MVVDKQTPQAKRRQQIQSQALNQSRKNPRLTSLASDQKWASFAAHKEAVLLDLINREREKQKKIQNETAKIFPDPFDYNVAPRIIVNIKEPEISTKRKANNNSRLTERTEARADSNFDRQNDGF